MLAKIASVLFLCALAAPRIAFAQSRTGLDPDSLLDPVGTFSILGYDPVTGEVGGAVQSRVFAVGNGVLWAEADVGVVATQAIVDVSYGPQAIALLRQGLAPDEVIRRLLAADPDRGLRGQQWPKAGRQVAVMNAKGEFAAHTGPEASVWAGHRQGKYVTAQGNILASEAVVTRMVEAFERTEGHLSHRLIAALQAGDAAGGDTRGRQSAAILIVKKGCGVWLNNDVVLRLQVDNDPDPITKLAENVAWWWTYQRRSRPACPDR
jgi:uncharacterized Ntn-hydrolase superfamily protein